LNFFIFYLFSIILGSLRHDRDTGRQEERLIESREWRQQALQLQVPQLREGRVGQQVCEPPRELHGLRAQLESHRQPQEDDQQLVLRLGERHRHELE
jgi:hypothetical protein